MAGWTGLEPAASAVTGRRYNQLNYHPAAVETIQRAFSYRYFNSAIQQVFPDDTHFLMLIFCATARLMVAQKASQNNQLSLSKRCVASSWRYGPSDNPRLATQPTAIVAGIRLRFCVQQRGGV
jgi:hypothetical protein